MGIKSFGPSKKSRYLQGYFENAKKYFGPLPIIYRSSWELLTMQKLEFNPAVEKWSSEHVSIPYTMQEKKDGKFVSVRHTYYTDFTVHTKDGKKYILEVKPLSLSPLNESQIKSNPAIYKNACKWKAALAWCKLNGYEFKVITEQHLKTRIF